MTMKWQVNLMLLSQFIIIACLDMSDPYWPLIISHFNHAMDPQHLQYWSAAIYIIPFLITIIATPLWSRLGEKIGHKKMLLRACVAIILTQVLIGFVSSPTLILLIRLLQGAFAGFTAAAQAWSISMSGSQTHSQVIGRMQSMAAMGSITGPLLGGIIANYAGYSAIFFVSAGICCLTVTLLAIFLTESPHGSMVMNSVKIKKLLSEQKHVFFFLGLICLGQVAKWMDSSYFALYATERLGANNLSVGALYSSIAFSIFLSASKWGAFIDRKIQDPHIIKLMLIATLLTAAMAQLIFAFTSHFYFALISALLWGGCIAAISIFPFALLVKESRECDKARSISFANSAGKLGNLIGVALGAFIQVQTNFTWSFIAIGFLYSLLAVILLFSQFELEVDAAILNRP
jgi:MFS family permease